MSSYTHYSELDPEWVEFAKTLKPPEPLKDLALAKRLFNESRAALFRNVLSPIERLYTEDVSFAARDGQSIQARLYFPDRRKGQFIPLPLLLYLHGGGYLMGNIESEDMHCRIYCVNVQCIVLNVDYRHTPEWTVPTPYHDVFDAVDWITEPQQAKAYGIDLERVIIAGVSAGATMALAAAMVEIENGTNRLKGLEISCPSTVHWTRFPRHLVKDGYSSFEQNAEAPLLPMTRLAWFYDLFKADPESRYMSSLLLPTSVLKDFPRVAFHVCGADALRDGGLLLEEQLRDLDVPTRLEVYAGFPHTFWNQPQLQASAKYRQRMGDDAKWLLFD